MAKLLTNREMELFRQALAALELATEGVPRETLAQNLAGSLSFEIDEDDIAECCEQISGS